MQTFFMCLTHLIQTLQYYNTTSNIRPDQTVFLLSFSIKNRISKISNTSIVIKFHVPTTFDEASTLQCHILLYN